MSILIYSWPIALRLLFISMLLKGCTSIRSVIVDAYENPKVNPFMRVANDSLANMVRIACEFGITPASASKVNANKKQIIKWICLKALSSDKV